MLSAKQFDDEIQRLRERVFPLARFIHEVSLMVDAPVLIDDPGLGFRFEQPTLIHFCLLRGARIVTALNASIELARCGYTQEIAVLLRTTIEYSTQIDFMLASHDGSANPSEEAAAFLSGFFNDARRGQGQETKRARLVQKKIHDLIGERLDNAMGNKAPNRKPASELLSNVYLVFSNYVHGRYPESMDLYGGTPGRFHLNGMRGTPKDSENLEILEVMITSASNCFKGIVQTLDLRSLVLSDPMLTNWMSENLGAPDEV